MKEVTARHIFGTIDFLAEKEYISADNETEALKLLPKSRDVLFGRERLVMKKVENSEKVVKTHRPEVPVNSDLLDALKALRKGIASKKSVPAYVIFTDATLIDMCKKCPETPDEMLEVSGVGRTKLEKFGKLHTHIGLNLVYIPRNKNFAESLALFRRFQKVDITLPQYIFLIIIGCKHTHCRLFKGNFIKQTGRYRTVKRKI